MICNDGIDVILVDYYNFIFTVFTTYKIIFAVRGKKKTLNNFSGGF